MALVTTSDSCLLEKCRKSVSRVSTSVLLTMLLFFPSTVHCLGRPQLSRVFAVAMWENDRSLKFRSVTPWSEKDERLMATTQLDPEARPAARSIQPMFTWCSNLHQMHEFCLCGWRLPFNACHDFTPKWWHDPGDICHERLVNRRRRSRTRKNGLWRISDTFPNYPKRFLSSQPNPLCHHYKQFRHSL